MDNLSMDLTRMCSRNRDGSMGTQKNRKLGLNALGRELGGMGYKLQDARSLKPKHVDALIELWRNADLDAATMRNRLTWLRWWAEKIDKPNIIARENKEYGVAYRSEATLNRAQTLDANQLEHISSPHVRAAILLQVHFGLRREEAMKFRPKLAIKADSIELKASWCKGGRARTIPLTTETQQHVLQQVVMLAGDKGSLIPQEKSYVQHLKTYEYQTLKVGMRNTHGFRHKYAQTRYQVLTGKLCPLAGGKRWREMTQIEREMDRTARLQISKELGHTRLQITDIYLGRAL